MAVVALTLALVTGALPRSVAAHAEPGPYRIYAAQPPALPAPVTFPAASARGTCWKYKPAERGFASKMNAERVERDKVRLRLDPELSKAARVHTREMVTKELLHHTESSSLRKRVTNWLILGENVGVGGTVDSLHAAFMASPGHRENILFSKFRFVGVGSRQALGRMWVTVIFESKANPSTPLAMPTC